MIEFYVLRHAVAKSRETWRGKDDGQRPLTRKGEKEMWRVAKAMTKLGLAFDLLLSSPYVRARRTAEIVRDVFKAGRKLQLSTSLATEADPRRFLKETPKLFRSAKSIIVVGHEPFLSELIALLTVGEARSLVKLSKGGLCKLTMESAHSRDALLEWLLTREQLVAMS